MSGTSLFFYLAFTWWLLLGLRVSAQNAAPTSYDVSTVKLARPGPLNSNIRWGAHVLKVENTTLLSLMANAFHARPDQISGQPPWANDLHFDITAKLIDSNPEIIAKLKGEQHRALIRALLVERFALEYHEETRELSTYKLEPAKGGLKLKPSNTSAETLSPSGVCSGCIIIGHHDIRAHDVQFTTFVEVLGKILKRNVDSFVNYHGKLDITLTWDPEIITGEATSTDPSLLPLPLALEQEMGLHLSATRGPVKLHHVDHLNRPSDN